MADKMLTPEFRCGFQALFRALPPKDNANGAKKYQIRALFPPTTDLSAMKAAAAQAATDKFGSNVPKNLRSPFRLNEELDKPFADIGDDWIVMTFTANENSRPGLVDANLQDIINEADVYSGAWFRAEVQPYGYDNAGNKGVAFGLENVQKLRDDGAIGSGRTPANKAFTPVAVAGATKSASNIFG